MSDVSVEKIKSLIGECNIVEDATTLDVEADLSDQGIDSLDLANILLKIDETYGIEIPDEAADNLTNIDSIYTYLKELNL